MQCANGYYFDDFYEKLIKLKAYLNKQECVRIRLQIKVLHLLKENRNEWKSTRMFHLANDALRDLVSRVDDFKEKSLFKTLCYIFC